MRPMGKVVPPLTMGLWAGTALAVLSVLICAPTGSALAQVPLDAAGAAGVPSDAQLFLEADTVTYDSDRSVVTATGGVQIDYGSYKVVARELVYDQQTRRLIARGDVELQQPDGNRIYADQLDLTDDFRDGFVQALRIETPDNTRFAAAAATRENGTVTTFERGVYTACEACRENPDRAPLWQVKARKIVWDQEAKEIRYYGAQFEFFGAPIAYLPYFVSPDPTVKRKSGFLAPSFHSSSELGYGMRVPYFVALSDDKDFTVAGTYYTKQGFLGEVEYRQAFQNGIITLQAAGISQNDRFEFEDDNFIRNGVPVLSPDYANTDRGMIGTKGQFALSDRWTFGWEWLFQSDDNFARTYEIEGFNQRIHTSEIYLTGLGDQSYFDLRAQQFDYQSTDPLLDDQQPFVRPTFDYERIEQEGLFGGEVKLDLNVASLTRDKEDSLAQVFGNETFYRYRALDGDYSRVTGRLSWRDTWYTPVGLVLSPTLAARGDVYTADMQASDFRSFGGGVDIDEDGTRGMVTAALEARYPYLIETASASHIIEPIAQFIARPDEERIGLLPNEDASTLVFNASNLFSLDKFSGYDRIEGGSRANVGVRYAGDFGGGWVIDALVGQSYHLGGVNSFAGRDLSFVGYDSGLETDRSDYVASLSLTTPFGVTLGTQGRYDEKTFELRRKDLFGTYTFERGSASIGYSNIAAQPLYGSNEDRSQVTGTGTLNFARNWSALAAVSYDIDNSALIEQSYGIRYADECFSLLVGYREETDRYSLDASSQTVMFKIGLRTISDFNQSIDVGGF